MTELCRDEFNHWKGTLMPTDEGVMPATLGRSLKPLSWHDVLTASAYFVLTGVIFFLGMTFGDRYVVEGRPHWAPDRVGFWATFTNWDSHWYASVARDGYDYDPSRMSSIAFFPAYPLLGRALAWVTGLPHGLALTILSNLFLWATLVLLLDYTRRRFPEGSPDLPAYTALALALCPVGFFFRVAYTESMFIFLTILTLYGIHRRWPVLALALIVGLATATRPTGIALIPSLVLAVWQQYPSWCGRLLALAAVLPLSCWGLGAFIAYQEYQFNEPLAFSQAQDSWRFRPKVPTEEHVLGVATGEPIWSVYDPDSAGYWARFDKRLDPMFSLQFANPSIS